MHELLRLIEVVNGHTIIVSKEGEPGGETNTVLQVDTGQVELDKEGLKAVVSLLADLYKGGYR